MLIGKHFSESHDFQSPAVLADGSVKMDYKLSENIGGKYALLFFYTLDFSYVCPTELYALGNRLKQFRSLNTEIIAISGDSHLSHSEWRNKPVELGGIGAAPFTLVSDISRIIARRFEVLLHDSMPMRATYIIDDSGHFRYEAVNDLPIGRNIDEILRVLGGLQTYQKTGRLIPANWRPGGETLIPLPDDLADFMIRNAGTL